MSAALRIAEVFESIQGEGIYLGARQIFVRLAGCNLECPYCDTPIARDADAAEAVVYSGARSDRLANPVPVTALVECARAFAGAARPHSVSWTGGEPLLQAGALADAMAAAREAGLRNYLETNGTLPDAMGALAPLVDFVAADVKLPTASAVEWDASLVADFLRVAAGPDLFVKTVVTEQTPPAEVAEAARVVAGVSRTIPMVIQPASPVRPGVRPPAEADLMEMQAAALSELGDVRIIGQMHRKLGVR